MFEEPTSACSIRFSTDIRVPEPPRTLARCIASPPEPCPPSRTLEPTPMPIHETRKPASLAPITWALRDMFLLASGSLGFTIDSDFCPTVILSPIEYPSRIFSASNLPSPFTFTSPGTLWTRYALPSSSLSATHSPMLSPHLDGLRRTFQVIQ